MDIKRIEALIEVIKGSHVSELSVKSDGSAVIVRKSAGGNGFAVTAPSQTAQIKTEAPVTEATQVESPAERIISAPMVGIFHSIDGFKGPGVEIKKGQVVGIIESMKLMNEIISQDDGTIDEILVDDGMPVEYGHPLFRLKEG